MVSSGPRGAFLNFLPEPLQRSISRLDHNAGMLPKVSRRSAWWVISLLALLVACGPDPLAQVGEGSSDWIQEPTVTTVASSDVGGLALAPVVGSDWFNNDLAPVGGTSPDEIIAGVYARAKPSDPFVQATPAEIAIALPGVVFPSLAPPEVRYITSQLVYDLGHLTLAADEVAAFGLWTVEPYTRSRSVGQQGVFTVMADAEGLAAMASGNADTSCAAIPRSKRRVRGQRGSCQAGLEADRSAWNHPRLVRRRLSLRTVPEVGGGTRPGHRDGGIGAPVGLAGTLIANFTPPLA